MYAVARPFTLAYFSGKALAVVAPVLTLVAVKALVAVASTPGGRRAAHGAPIAARCALRIRRRGRCLERARLAGERMCGPPSAATTWRHSAPIVEGQPTVYLARDNFAPWELRGAQLRGFQSYDTALALGIDERAREVRGRRAPAGRGRRLGGRLLLVARALPGHPAYRLRLEPAAELPPDRWTRWHVLWERRGPMRAAGDPRRGRGAREGARLPNRPRPAAGAHAGGGVRAAAAGRSGDAWRGALAARRSRPRAERRLPVQELQLGPGTWDISLRYFSDLPLRVRAGSLDTSLPAYVADSSTFASAGRVVPAGGPLKVTVAVPAAEPDRALRTVKLGTLAATRVDDRGGLVPLARACGKYVDWFRVGAGAR